MSDCGQSDRAMQALGDGENLLKASHLKFTVTVEQENLMVLNLCRVASAEPQYRYKNDQLEQTAV